MGNIQKKRNLEGKRSAVHCPHDEEKTDDSYEQEDEWDLGEDTAEDWFINNEEEARAIAFEEAVHILPLEVVALDGAVLEDAHVVYDGRALAHSVIHRYGDRPVRREK